MELNQYADLQNLDQHQHPIFTSKDLAESSHILAKRFTDAYEFFCHEFTITPQVGLLVLSADDWLQYAALPDYGLTHYAPSQGMVITAGQSHSFWQSAIDLITDTTPQLLDGLKSVYSRPDGTFDLTIFDDLLIVHDLGHAFHLHMSYEFPRKWLMEWFANLCAYTYLAQMEPNQLTVLTTFPRVMTQLGIEHFRYHSLTDFDDHYMKDIAFTNYVWYHGHLMKTVEFLYDKLEVAGLKRVWETFVEANVQTVTDAQLTELLQQVHPDLGEMISV